LTFGDFTTKSGRKSPYFINTGKYQTGAHISALGDFYADSIMASGSQFDMLFGPAYKGIPLAVAAASSLYRKYGKKHTVFVLTEKSRRNTARAETSWDTCRRTGTVQPLLKMW
jgi:orotate phosphoribosyltransferase